MPEKLPCHCHKCKQTWDFYDEKDTGDRMSTAVQYQGLICPQCGNIGVAGVGMEEVPESPVELVAEVKPEESKSPMTFKDQVASGEIGNMRTVSNIATIRINPEADAVFLDMKKAAQRLLEWGKVRVIDNAADEKSAGEDLGACSTLLKKLNAAKEEWTIDIKTNLELVSGAFNDVIKPLQEIEKTLKEKVIAYRAEKKRQAAIIEEANRIAIDNARKEAAAHNGEISTPVIINPVPVAPAKHIYAATGTLGETETWDFEIVDFKLLPDEYKIITADLVKIRKAVVKNKGKLFIPGVNQFKKEGLRITTK
jgi:hypothetical protein